MKNASTQEVCCPRFDSTGWDDELFEWDGKRFIKESAKTFMFAPVNFGSVMRRLNKEADAAGAANPDHLCLSEHTSQSNMDVYLAVDREVPGAENVTIGGTFFSTVYEGDFKNMGTWIEDFEHRAEERGLKIKKMYMWYTTCPKCAKKYGENYTVVIGQV